ncbi:MAG TPA: diacylglycerol kinase family protein [Rubricoccaceae bacterium]|nr:diacylglycerol kinase family protein [Rubricoccaceae bacterium]
MRYAIVLNPAAANGRAGRQRAALEAALARTGVDYTLALTQAPGDGTPLAREAAASHDVVVAVGGDGTIHEVARGLLGTAAVMGALPLGTGNDFAHAVGMPDNLDAAVGALLTAPECSVDLGRVRWTEGDDPAVHEAVFANCLGVGFDALAAIASRRFKYLGRGRVAYLAGVLRTLRSWPQPEVEARVADGEGEPEVWYAGPFFLVEVGNGFSVGGGFLLTPDASVNDGLLDVCLIERTPTRRVLRLLPTTFEGKHVGEPEVHLRRLRRLTLRSEADLPAQADGEIVTTRARFFDVEVLPGALRVRTPRIRGAEPAAPAA